MSESLNAPAPLAQDNTDEQVISQPRPAEPDVLIAQASEVNPTVVEPKEQGSDIEIIASLESLAKLQDAYQTLQRVGTINKARVVDINTSLEGIAELNTNEFTDVATSSNLNDAMTSLVSKAIEVAKDGQITGKDQSFLIERLTLNVQDKYNALTNICEQVKHFSQEAKCLGISFQSASSQDPLLNALRVSQDDQSGADYLDNVKTLIKQTLQSTQYLLSKVTTTLELLHAKDLTYEDMIEALTLTDEQAKTVSIAQQSPDAIQLVSPATPSLGVITYEFSKEEPLSSFSVSCKPNTLTLEEPIELPDSGILESMLEGVGDCFTMIEQQLRDLSEEATRLAVVPNRVVTKAFMGSLPTFDILTKVAQNQQMLIYQAFDYHVQALVDVANALAKLITEHSVVSTETLYVPMLNLNNPPEQAQDLINVDEPQGLAEHPAQSLMKDVVATNPLLPNDLPLDDNEPA